MQIFIYDQYSYFIYSLLLGGVLGALYDLFCTLPFSFKGNGKYSVFFDFIFTLVSFFLTFVIAYDKNSGQVRGYALLSTFAIFLIYRLTVGAKVKKIIFYLSKHLKNLFGKTRDKINYLLDIFLKFVKINYKRTKAKIRGKVKNERKQNRISKTKA